MRYILRKITVTKDKINLRLINVNITV